MPKQLETSVGFIIYHRPEKTKVVFEAIRQAKPRKLFVFADGPRDESDKIKCEETRKIIEGVDWECEVHKNFQDKNLGCRLGEFTAFEWIFENNEQAILLEDDTVPDPTFFGYCEELLEKYKNDERIFQIAGVNFQKNNPEFQCDDSYYFSSVTQTWGWASWRRAWQYYDLSMKDWPEFKRKGMLKNIFSDPAVVHYWEYLMDKTYNRADSWDAQWVFAGWKRHGLSIIPRVNLITNIGYGEGAAHKAEYMRRAGESSPLVGVPTSPMETPLKHPDFFCVDKEAEKHIMKLVFRINNTTAKKIRWFFKFHFPKLYGWVKKIT